MTAAGSGTTSMNASFPINSCALADGWTPSQKMYSSGLGTTEVGNVGNPNVSRRGSPTASGSWLGEEVAERRSNCSSMVKWLTASSGKEAGTSAKESPMEILKRRYAAGEIGKEEFEEKKKDLQA